MAFGRILLGDEGVSSETRKPSGAWQKYPYNQTYGIIRAKNG